MRRTVVALQRGRRFRALADERKCFLTPALAQGRKIFGLAAHLYALRGKKPSALGNFATLGEYGETAREAGAAFAGINPFYGQNTMYFPVGRSVYNALQVSLRQRVTSNPFGVMPFVHGINFQFS